jgi:hypothetical protein
MNKLTIYWFLRKHTDTLVQISSSRLHFQDVHGGGEDADRMKGTRDTNAKESEIEVSLPSHRILLPEGNHVLFLSEKHLITKVLASLFLMIQVRNIQFSSNE